MSPLQPPWGLSATLCSPKDVAVPPAPQTSETLVPGLLRFQQLFPGGKHHHGLGASAPEQRLGSGTYLQVLRPPQAKPLPSFSLPIPSAVPGCEGWPGTRTPYLPCPRVGNLLPSAVIGPAGCSKRRARDGEQLSRALPPCTERRDFGARKAVADPPPSRPSPPPAHPSGRQECVVGTARLPPPNFSSSPRCRDHPDLRNAQCQEKEPPAPGRCRGNRDIRGHLSAERGESGQGKEEKCFPEKFGVAFACVPSPAHPPGLGSHLAPYTQRCHGAGG